MYSSGLSSFPDNSVSNLEGQPHAVFSSPGLGHFAQDFALYVPISTYEKDVKEVEKGLTLEKGSGGFELNSPLISNSMDISGEEPKKKKGRAKKHKGHGKTKNSVPTQDNDAKKIEDIMNYPIKVHGVLTFMQVLFFNPSGRYG